MKKLLSFLILSLLVVVLAACGNAEDTAKEENNAANEETNETENKASETTEPVTLTVGASYGIHELVLEQVQPILAEEGIELVIEGYQDYVMPNQDLESGEIDANYFQHIPYFENEVAEKGYDFANAGGIHVEPIGLYSTKHKSLDELPDNATVIISNSPTDKGRILGIFEDAGVIKLKDGVERISATLDDIVENPKNLVFDDKSNPEMLVTYYEEGEGDVVAINSNFAIDAKIKPNEDAIAVESTESAYAYANIIAVRSGEENSDAIKRLVEVLHSKEIQDFITQEWSGAVVPVSQ